MWRLFLWLRLLIMVFGCFAPIYMYIILLELGISDYNIIIQIATVIILTWLIVHILFIDINIGMPLLLPTSIFYWICLLYNGDSILWGYLWLLLYYKKARIIAIAIYPYPEGATFKQLAKAYEMKINRFKLTELTFICARNIKGIALISSVLLTFIMLLLGVYYYLGSI